MRKEIPLLLTFLMAMAAVVSTWINFGDFDLRSILDEYLLVWESFIILLGIINLTRIHATNVRRRRPHWYASAWLLICMYGYSMLGIFETNQGENFQFVYRNIMSPLGATMYSMLAFYIASAAYRAFRVRSREATVLLVSAIIVMLARAPIGAAIWSYIPKLGGWIMDVPNTAAVRGILLGVEIGIYATYIRVLLGLERAHLGGTGE